jgi:hypothetical protein
MIMVGIYLAHSKLLIGLSFLTFIVSWLPALIEEALDELRTPPGWGGGGE